MKRSLLLRAVLMFLLQEMRRGTRGVMLRLLYRTALVIVACLLGLGVILGGTGEAARDPLSPACEKYAYRPPSDTRTLAHLKQECARFLAAGIRKGVAANDQWDVQALLGWARQTLQACSGADDPLLCAEKLDRVAALTPAEPPRRPRPAPPRKRAPPEVAPVPKDEVSKPSPTPDGGAGGAIFVVVLVAVLLVILLLAFVAKSAPVVATPNPPDRCPRCGSPYFHRQGGDGDIWICDGPGCGSKFEAGREGTATQESVQGGEKPTEEKLTLIEAVELTSAEMFIEAVAKVRASIGEGLFKEVLGENPDTFNKEACHLVEELMIFCLLLADRISFPRLEPEHRAKFMDFLIVNVGSSLPASILQSPSQEVISAYQRDFFNLYSRRSKALAGFDLPTRRTRGDDLFTEAARIIAKEWYAGSGQHDDLFAAKWLELILVDWKSMRALSARLAEIRDCGTRKFAAVLVSSGKSKNKWPIIWAVHTITGMGLEEAKALVDGAPKPIKEGISFDEAVEIEKRLEVAGAGVLIEEIRRPDHDDKGEFSVILVSVGEGRAEVFKEVRAITGLSRKGVNDLLDGTPKPVKEGTTRAKAEEIKRRLEEAGATVKIKEVRRPNRGETR